VTLAPDPYDRAAVSALSHVPLSSSSKGLGGLADGTTAAELAAARTSVFGGAFSFPLLTVRASAVAHNVSSMAAWCAEAGVELAPHAKTTMAPQIFAAQLDAGAWGLTVASLGQAQVCRDFSARRLLVANEVVDRVGIAWLAAELRAHPEFEVLCYVDSLEGVALLDSCLRTAGGLPTELGVLVELGFEGGRTGCRSTESARAVAAAASATATLRVAGVAGYEGGLAHDRSPAAVDAITAFCRRLADFAAELAAGPAAAASGPLVITAGGSAYPDLVAGALAGTTQWATVVLRSGCYVTHDDGEYARVSPFAADAAGPYVLTAALELWAPVLSRPEPGLALLGAGRRDVGFDQGLPVPLTRRDATGGSFSLTGAAVSALNDQHAYLSLPAATELAVGDLVSLGVSHPCTTLDRWRTVVAVDDEYRVTDVVQTFF
jgi:D-serine deaminase-like pyridoxal phosphate-dependent protein